MFDIMTSQERYDDFVTQYDIDSERFADVIEDMRKDDLQDTLDEDLMRMLFSDERRAQEDAHIEAHVKRCEAADVTFTQCPACRCVIEHNSDSSKLCEHCEVYEVEYPF